MLIAGGVLILGYVLYLALRPLPGRATGTPEVPPPIPSASNPALPRKTGLVRFLGSDGGTKAIVNVEIVDEARTREAGLMFRRSLGRNFGMLFVFDSSAVQTFWMKNTLLPLDMIFIDEKGKVVTIHRNTTPRSLQTYPSAEPSLCVVEVNGGFSDAHGLDVGDLMEWRRDTVHTVR